MHTSICIANTYIVNYDIDFIISIDRKRLCGYDLLCSSAGRKGHRT